MTSWKKLIGFLILSAGIVLSNQPSWASAENKFIDQPFPQQNSRKRPFNHTPNTHHNAIVPIKKFKQSNNKTHKKHKFIIKSPSFSPHPLKNLSPTSFDKSKKSSNHEKHSKIELKNSISKNFHFNIDELKNDPYFLFSQGQSLFAQGKLAAGSKTFKQALETIKLTNIDKAWKLYEKYADELVRLYKSEKIGYEACIKSYLDAYFFAQTREANKPHLLFKIGDLYFANIHTLHENENLKFAIAHYATGLTILEKQKQYTTLAEALCKFDLKLSKANQPQLTDNQRKLAGDQENFAILQKLTQRLFKESQWTLAKATALAAIKLKEMCNLQNTIEYIYQYLVISCCYQHERNHKEAQKYFQVADKIAKEDLTFSKSNRTNNSFLTRRCLKLLQGNSISQDRFPKARMGYNPPTGQKTNAAGVFMDCRSDELKTKNKINKKNRASNGQPTNYKETCHMNISYKVNPDFPQKKRKTPSQGIKNTPMNIVPPGHTPQSNNDTFENDMEDSL